MKIKTFSPTPGKWEIDRCDCVFSKFVSKNKLPDSAFEKDGTPVPGTARSVIKYFDRIHLVEERCNLNATAPKMFNVLKKCLDFLKRCPMTRNGELEKEIEEALNEATNTEKTK